ncbi:MAG: hypothetical protein AAFN10_07680 [Bacteroidota bacterium]
MKKLIAAAFVLLCLACQSEPKGVTSFTLACEEAELGASLMNWIGLGFRLDEYVGKGNYEVIELGPKKKKVKLKGYLSEEDAFRFVNLSKSDLVFAETVAAQESRKLLFALDSIFSRDSLVLHKPSVSLETAEGNGALSSTDQLLAEDKWSAEDSLLRAWTIYEKPIETLIYLFEDYTEDLSSPLIGSVAIKDTAAVNRILSIAASKGLLGNVRFVYAQQAEKGADYLLLYSMAYDPALRNYQGLSGSYIEDMQIYDVNEGRYQAQIHFNEAGIQLWEEMTRAQTGRFIGMLLDGKVWSMPRVNEPIQDGLTAVQLGTTPIEQAMQFAIIINIGPMKHINELGDYQYDSLAVWPR